jgi:hypothetical protein
MSTALLCRLEAVSKYYRPAAGPRLWAVANLSLEVRAGEVLGLLGPTGAGKSTVLRLLGARLRPSSGRVWHAEGAIRRLALLDEPQAAPISRDDLLATSGAAVVATGSTALAHHLCDRVILLDRGRSPGSMPADSLAPWLGRPWYRIRLQGHLTPRTLQWLEDLTCWRTPQGETVLLGALPDSAALYGVLHRIERLHLPLLEVAAVEPTEALVRGCATASQTPVPD